MLAGRCLSSLHVLLTFPNSMMATTMRTNGALHATWMRTAGCRPVFDQCLLGHSSTTPYSSAAYEQEIIAGH